MVVKMMNIKDLTETTPMNDSTAQSKAVAKLRDIECLTEAPGKCATEAMASPDMATTGTEMMYMTDLMRIPDVCDHLTQDCQAPCQVRLATEKP